MSADVGPPPATRRVRPIADMREAIAVAREDTVILALMWSKATFAIGAGVVSQLAVLASDVFHSGDRGRGLLLAARGVGSGLGPFLAARWAGGSLRRVMTLCGWASLAFSCTYIGAAWAPTLAVALGFVFLAHLGGGAHWTLSTYGLQRRVDDSVLGRVMAGDFAIVTLVLSVTSIGAGLLSSAVGVQWAITVFAALAAVAGTVYLVSRGRSARIWRPDARQPAHRREPAHSSVRHTSSTRERPIDNDRHPRTQRRTGRPDDGVRRSADGRRPHGRGGRAHLLRAAQGDRRPDPAARAAARRPARPRPLPARVGARPGQDARRRDAGRRRRRHVRPHPVHARPAAVRHRRHPHLPRQQRAVRRRARPGVRQLPAHRRDQPGAGQGAVGAARGDAGAPGDDRRHHPPGARRRSSSSPPRTRSRARACTSCPTPSATAS